MRTVVNALTRLAVVFCATVLCVLAGSVAASAATPTTWPDPEPTTYLHELLLYGGSVVGLVVLLILFSLTLHRNNYVPPTPADDNEAAEIEHTGEHEAINA